MISDDGIAINARLSHITYDTCLYIFIFTTFSAIGQISKINHASLTFAANVAFDL